MNPNYPFVADRAGHRCEYCHAPQSAFNFAFEIEHITPTAGGGEDTPDNYALACRACNAFKAARRQGADPETGQTTRLFHPRQDVWSEHFAVDAETLDIRGLTPIGRTTVEVLRMNASWQQSARRQWLRLDSFP
jgi:hypothetical protein